MLWKDIANFKGRYSVSMRGEIYSKKNHLIMKQTTNTGYLRLSLVSNDGRRRGKYVHRLVAETFIPNPEGKSQVNHKDGNPLNNRVDNLEWVTPKENMIHASELGRFKDKRKGTKNPKSKFTNDDISEIRKMREQGHTLQYIADRFNCSISTVSMIYLYKTWTHI